jgi:hypothetical protein
MEVLQFTNSEVFNYFFSVYVYISAPIFIGLSIMAVLRN